MISFSARTRSAEDKPSLSRWRCAAVKERNHAVGTTSSLSSDAMRCRRVCVDGR